MNALRGFKDILPNTIEKWQFLENTARVVIESFGFQEVRTPILEKTELFERSTGKATDIVEKEMYTFLDKNLDSITLRPEGTAGIVRCFIENNLNVLPIKKFYYIGPMFRYEKPQKGRLRQFHQIGIEVFGSNHPYIDAEIVFINIVLLEKLGITDYKVEINNIGCPNCRPHYLSVLQNYFLPFEKELCDDCQKRLYKNPLRILDCKRKQCQVIAKNAPKVIDFVCNDCKMHYKNVKTSLINFNINFKENFMLVRGLDYYTKFVFEITSDKLGTQGTISAGGRYDNLVEELGSAPTPGIGFAMGCERIIELMDKNLKKVIDFYVINLNVDDYTIKISNKLRNITNKIVYVNDEKRSLKSNLKKADKLNVKYVIILGENEKNNNTIVFKDLKHSQQFTYNTEDFLSNEVMKWL